MGLTKSGCILLIAPRHSYRIVPFIQAADKLGIPIKLISEGETALVTERLGGIQVEFSHPEKTADSIVASLENTPVLAVTGTDDLSVVIASTVAKKLGLACNHVDAVKLTQRKDLARQRLLEAGLPVPKFAVIDTDIDLRSQVNPSIFPAVVKPLMLSGSRGVIRVDSFDELQRTIPRVKSIIEDTTGYSGFERSHLLLEKYIPGSEIAVEAIVDKRGLQLLTVFDKPVPLEGPYFEETIYVTPSNLSTSSLEKISHLLSAACNAYGIHSGPIHAELRINNDDMMIIEIASRTIGGQCARLMKSLLGESLEELVLRQAMGQEIHPPVSQTASGVMMIPVPASGILRRVENLAAARNVNYIDDIELTLAPGNEVSCLPEGDSYLGFIFATAPDSPRVVKALNAAYQLLDIVVAEKIPVLLSS